ncbi:MAG: maleylpyruvate isomerase N-terminal domain-containing protein [Mycobacteriales bacterium]|nr:maleylpyruvate isomerase N-terminal domain-containing protein [Frankia sp.]
MTTRNHDPVTNRPRLSRLSEMFDREGRALVARVRDWGPQRWAAASACTGWSRADAVHHLVQALAIYAHGIEAAADDRPAQFRRPKRPPYDAAIVDQLAVAVRDLATAITRCAPGTAVWHPRHRLCVEQLAGVALSETILHRWDVDGAPLVEESAQAVLETLHPRAAAARRRLGYAGSAGELLLELTGRGAEPVDDWRWEIEPA